MKFQKQTIVAFVLLGLPSVAYANAGTPLMWASILHLLLGNLFIGLLEGFLLAKLFNVSRKRAVELLILANYFSAWMGGILVVGGISSLIPMDLNNAWGLFWLLVVLTYVITLLFEFPFVAFVFRGDPLWRKKAVRGSLVIQTLSYTILFGWYWMASGTSLYTKTKVVDLSSISMPERVLMYYISIDDGDVYARSLAEPAQRSVFNLNSTHRNDRLLVRRSTADSNTWDLVARLETDDHNNPNLIPIQESFASIAAPTWRSEHTVTSQYPGTWFNFGPVPKLGDAKSSDWEFRSGFWQGFSGDETNTDTHIAFSFETPFAAWPVRNATHLPTDKVLLQLGDDQICLYDPIENSIALVVKGRGPIAIIQDGK